MDEDERNRKREEILASLEEISPGYEGMMLDDDDEEEDSDELGEMDEYHPESCPGECPGTCDYCGFWWCPYADEVAQCDKGCEGYVLFGKEPPIQN